MTREKTPITVADGDGIGPEIMSATLQILEASGAALEIHKVEIGEKVYLKGEKTGIESNTWDVIRNTKAFLKAPITTPQGGGFKSLNVTVRTTLGLYANVRPCVSYLPFVDTHHPDMNVVIIRENEEDLYTGIEYRLTNETYHALKVITKPGCERIIRYAFEFAKAHHRKKVTCFTKDNILKFTDGLFHKIFDEIAKDYPQIQNEHWIVDIGAAKLADTPNVFDVVVMPNLYGDILSDVAAQIAGSVGLAGSANIGEHAAMFEAIHGSAPRRAGQNLANPSGLLLGAIMMLVHIGQPDTAGLIHNAWLKTLEDGIHTYDIFNPAISKEKVGTKEFAKAVVLRLGKKPQTLTPVEYSPHSAKILTVNSSVTQNVHKQTVGADVFIQFNGDVSELYKKLAPLQQEDFKLTMIGNRGVRVWPVKMPETSCVDCWRCRFMSSSKENPLSKNHIASLVKRLAEADLDFTEIHTLANFDGTPGYTVAQDEQ